MNGEPKPFLLLQGGQGGQVQYPEEGLEAPIPLWVPPPKVSGLVGLGSWPPGSRSRLGFPHLHLSQLPPPLCPHQSDHSE